MYFMSKKGQTNNPNGRPKGIPNKSTTLAREAIAKLVEANAPKMMGWLDEIANKHGELVAWKCMHDVMEYHLPKLARTEHAGDPNAPMETIINVNKTIRKVSDADTES